jgi:hypothetical protein
MVVVPLLLLALTIPVLLTVSAGPRATSAPTAVVAPPAMRPATRQAPAERPTVAAASQTPALSATSVPPLAPAPASAQEPGEVVEYRLVDDGERGVSTLLTALMDDPWIRMNPDQRSQFLGAMLRAQRAYEAELYRAFEELDDNAAIAALERDAAARSGERLAEELATFLSSQQMAQLRGRISFRDVMRGFFRAHAIAEVR